MKSKRILSLVLAMVMVLGAFGTVFADVVETEDHRIEWLKEQGILQGDGTGEFGLEGSLLRSELARIVAVALEAEAAAQSLKSSNSGFADMTPAHWANGFAAYANSKGYMIGNNKNEFMPNGKVSYAEALVVLTKIALDGDLTPAEKANSLTWYGPYVAKAAELGLTEGVSITNVGAEGVKEDVLKMLYNVLNNKAYGNYNVLKVVVLENDRIARLGENQVTVEVIKEVQIANFVEESRKSQKGEQFTYELPAKFNAEDLLGKVVDLSINKDNKVVEVKVDESYEVITGAISGMSESRLTIGGKQYIVNLDERYNKEDERVYRTYLNDKDLKYVNFAKDEKAEYARVTVKAGKVLFIDAYNFEDVMPVKEVKEIRGKDTIVSYDDVRQGNLLETEVKKDRVILVNDKTFTKGTLEDVKVDNVIHTYKVGTATKYVVLQDKAIVGKLDRVTETKTKTSVVVGDKAYDVPTESPKEAVYEFESHERFYTLSAKDAYRELDTFRGEEVKVLLGLDGKLQYIGSQVDFVDYLGVATRIVGDQMRVLNPDNELENFEADLDTVIKAGQTTGHKNLNSIDVNDLVYVNANDKTLVKVVRYDNAKKVEKLDARNIELATRGNFRITDETVIFVVNTDGKAEVRTLKDVRDAYDDLVSADKAKVTAALVDEDVFDEVSLRGDKFARATNAHTIVFHELNIAPKTKDAVYGKLIRYYDRTSGRSEILVELTNGSEVRFLLDAGAAKDVKLVEEEYYVIEESKETEGLVVTMKKANLTKATVSDIVNGTVYKISGKEYFEVRNTEFFGRKPRVNDVIRYEANSNDDLLIVVNLGKGEVVEAGVVTYITGKVADSNKDEVVLTVTLPSDNTKFYTVAVFNGSGTLVGPATVPAAVDVDVISSTQTYKRSALQMGTTDGEQFIIKVYEGNIAAADLDDAKVVGDAKVTVKDLAKRTFTTNTLANGASPAPATVSIGDLVITAKIDGPQENDYYFDVALDAGLSAIEVTKAGKNFTIKYPAVGTLVADLNANADFNALFTASGTITTAAGIDKTVNGTLGTGKTLKLAFSGKMTEATSVTMTVKDNAGDSHVVIGTITDWTTNTATVEFTKADDAVLVVTSTITAINLVSNNAVEVNMTTPVTIN